MRKTLALFLLLFLYGAFVQAQNTTVPKIMDDSTSLLNSNDDENANSSGFAKDVLSDTTINFSDFSIKSDSITALKQKKEYGWITNIDSFLLAQKKDDSTQSKIEIKKNSGSSFLSNLFNSGILQVLMWILAAALVLFIVYKLFLSEGVFGRRSAKAAINVETDDDDTRLAKDYEELLRKAYGEGNWRFAMRFLFLKTLQKLNENEMIHYAVDKTNSAYVKELTAARKGDFTSLALYYEYVWYGKAAIDKTVFDVIENKFNNFLNKI